MFLISIDMEYTIKRKMDHYEVYDSENNFVMSADTYEEARVEMEDVA